MHHEPVVHVYASGRQLVIVPVVTDAHGDLVEIDAVQTVPITLGRPTVVRLSRALSAAREASNQRTAGQPRWDGERGRWWAHHLLGLTIRWEKDQIALTELHQDDAEPAILPADTTDIALAERLIELLGQKLHAT
ncbi:MAG: hypothetical protein JXC32_10555 [Anaerolineae bacterium]|nr:hypothetical protein [Anaerolineae bacterium]